MNKRLVYTIGAILVIFGVAIYFFANRENIRNYPPGDGPVVALGDSLVAGTGASEGSDFVSLLSNMIREPIVNLGVSGNTAADGLARIDDVVSRHPRVAIVLLGGNDFLRKISRDETFANLREIVKKLQASGSVVLILGVRSNILIDDAAKYYKDLANETRSAFVPDVLDGILGDSRYMSDSVHPNDAGYARIAQKVYPTLAKIIR